MDDVQEYKFSTTMNIKKMSRFHDFPHVPEVDLYSGVQIEVLSGILFWEMLFTVNKHFGIRKSTNKGD